MRKRIGVGLIAAMLVLSQAVPAYGWNNRGHMMVAGVAYLKLTQHAKDRVDTLLQLNPDHNNWLALIPAGTNDQDKRMMVFMIAATWPDRIKSNLDYHDDGPSGGNRPPDDGTANNNVGYTDFARHKYWHFVDLPFSLDGTTLPPVPVPNAQTRITDFRAVLASDSPDLLKSYDLSWLLHLVGDIHQPLHCTTRVSHAKPDGDSGGNGVKLSGTPNNLHSFWDDVLGTSNSVKSAKTAAEALAAAPAAAANDLDVQHWVDESFKAAKTTAYKNPPIKQGSGASTPTVAYKKTAGGLAQKRIALAGGRLAKILNAELK
jgi:hypothetical protein